MIISQIDDKQKLDDASDKLEDNKDKYRKNQPNPGSIVHKGRNCKQISPHRTSSIKEKKSSYQGMVLDETEKCSQLSDTLILDINP